MIPPREWSSAGLPHAWHRDSPTRGRFEERHEKPAAAAAAANSAGHLGRLCDTHPRVGRDHPLQPAAGGVVVHRLDDAVHTVRVRARREALGDGARPILSVALVWLKVNRHLSGGRTRGGSGTACTGGTPRDDSDSACGVNHARAAQATATCRSVGNQCKTA
eukprot:2497978-Prymnesium_polylepis.1